MNFKIPLLTLLLIILSFTSAQLFAINMASKITNRNANQTANKIEIKVIDDESNLAISRANIHIQFLDSLIYEKTNAQGKAYIPKFSANLNNKINKVLINISKLGYQRIYETVSLTRDTTFRLKIKNIITDEIVVTGQMGSGSSSKSVFPVKIISEEMIKSKGASNLRELLNTETGINISQDNVLGSSISINGISGNNVKIMIDGVPVIGRLNGNVDLSQINLNNIERVEIIEGPMSAQYGSDALGGVINLISKKVDSKKVNYYSNLKYESVGVYNADIGLNKSYGNTKLALSFGRNIFRGFDIDQDKRNKQWNPKLQYFGQASVEHSNRNYLLRLNSSVFDELILDRGTPPPPYKETAFDNRYKTLRIVNTLKMEKYFTDDNFYDFLFSHSYYKRRKNTSFIDLTTLKSNLVSDPTAHDTTLFNSYYLQTNYYYKPNHSNFNMMLGLNLNFDYAQGKRMKGNNNINDYALFSSAKYSPIKSLDIQPSLRYIYNTKYDAPLLPALNIKYNVAGDKNIVLRASYGHGYRSPSLKELFLEFVDSNHKIYPSDSLEAEQSDSYNLSLRYNAELKKNYFQIESKFYFNNIYNKIELISTDGTANGIFQNRNIGNYESTGSTISFKYIRENLLFNVSYSLLGSLNFYHDQENQDRYNFSNDLSANMDYTFKSLDFKANLFFKYTGTKYRFSSQLNEQSNIEELIEYEVEDYNMLDFSLNKVFFDGIINTTVGIKNLLDVENIQSGVSDGGVHSSSGSSRTVAWGRTLFLNIKIDY